MKRKINCTIIALCLLPLVACQFNRGPVRNYQQPQQQLEALPEQHEILDIETPEVFSFTASPLQQPESLQNKPYFDFLSTLYRHDAGKKSLFTNPPRYRRGYSQLGQSRQKRAVVFRPLFVYRQQEIRKQKVQSLNKVRRH